MLTSTSASSNSSAPAQGSSEWLEWRSKGLGASEIAAVLGESDHDTPLSLWKLKTGRTPPKENNMAMQVGQEQEAKIRALYELDTGLDCPPALFCHGQLEWARCSLDGWVADRKLVVEMKCFGAEKHAMVKAGQVPPGYMAQLQWQMFVTDAKVVHFVSLDMATLRDLVILPVTQDLAYWERMIPAATKFWEEYIVKDVAPPLTDRDALEVTDEIAAEAFVRWKHAKLLPESEAQKLALSAARAEIDALTKAIHPKLRCHGVRAAIIQRKTGPSLDIRLETT